MVPHKLLLGVHDDLKLLFTVVTERVRLLVGEEMQKLQLDADMVQPLMDDFSQLQTERLVIPRNVAHGVGLLKDVLVPEQRFVGWRVEADHVGEHPPMLVLQVAELPRLEVFLFPLADLFDELSNREDEVTGRRRRLHRVEAFLQRFDRGKTVLHKLAVLQVVVKLFFLGEEEAPGEEEVQFAAGERQLDCRGIGQADLAAWIT